MNLAACHVRAVTGGLADRAAGVFVTSFYTSASLAGFTIVQLALLCVVGAVAAGAYTMAIIGACKHPLVSGNLTTCTVCALHVKVGLRSGLLI